MSQAARWNATQAVELAQGKIYYRDTGEGEALLFVHGLLVDGTVWHEVVTRLASKYRCIVPDLPLGSHPEAMNPDADLSPGGIASLRGRLLPPAHRIPPAVRTGSLVPDLPAAARVHRKPAPAAHP